MNELLLDLGMSLRPINGLVFRCIAEVIAQQSSHIEQTIVCHWCACGATDPQRRIEDIHSKRKLRGEQIADAACGREHPAACPLAHLRQAKASGAHGRTVRLESDVYKSAGHRGVRNQFRHLRKPVRHLKLHSRKVQRSYVCGQPHAIIRVVR